jgi:hypothetical protein
MATVKELKDFIVAGEAAKNFVNIYLKDGFQLTDLAGLIGLYPSFEQAFTGVSDIPSELSDLDDAEIDELVAAIGEELVQDEAWQDVFSGILKMWKGIHTLVNRKDEAA